MAMHKSGRNDVKTPGATTTKDSSVKNDIGKRGGQEMYLRDYITRKQEGESFYLPCNVAGDKWAVWPDGTECALEEKRDFEALLQWKSDDYEVKVAIGYDETGSPVFEKKVKKMTFEEWWSQSPEQLIFGDRRKDYFEQCWNAAQENK